MMNMLMMRPWALTTLSMALAVGASLAPATAQAATVYYNSNGTFNCRATNFSGQTAFYYNHQYIWNGSSGNQYLTCVLPTARVSNGNDSVNTHLFWVAGGVGGTVTCTAQMGSYYSGTADINSGNTVMKTIAANAASTISFGIMDRIDQWATINIICNVPSGFKLGLIQNIETD